MARRLGMNTPGDFSEDPARDSAPDHSEYGDSEQHGPESLHPTLTASVTWVRFSPTFHGFLVGY